MDMAMRTNQLNDLEDRITFINQDIRQERHHPERSTLLPAIRLYFVKETNQTNLKEAYTIARHEVHLPLEDGFDNFWPIEDERKSLSCT